MNGSPPAPPRPPIPAPTPFFCLLFMNTDVGNPAGLLQLCQARPPNIVTSLEKLLPAMQCPL